MLISSLRALRAAQQRLPSIEAGALSAVWRGLATGDASGGSGGSIGGGEGTPLFGGSIAGSSSRTLVSSSAAAATAAAPADNEQFISIDRSALISSQPHSHDPAVLAAAAAAAGVEKEQETDLVRHLKALIQFRGGPITLAEFMSEVLTNPQHGYYTQRDVFGTAGDFITSPEISQMFGELVGIWCVATWQQLGCPSSLHLVELGPGRGTLMADLLRGTAAFKEFSQALRVSMVEVSPHLRGMQWQALRCPGPPPQMPDAADTGTEHSSSSSSDSSSGGGSLDGQVGTRGGSGSSRSSTGDSQRVPGPLAGASGWGGVPVSWHRSLEEVQPEGPALYIAHEFLDALPVHQFQRTERGWCERLVDVAAPDSPLHLRLVLSPSPTPAARVLLPRRLRQLPLAQQVELEALEVCPQGMALAESLAQRVQQHGGAALIVDYGQDAPYQSSLQAIRRHEFVGLLEQPGSADLSNRVDYSALRSTVAETGAAADCLGPIPQSHFLLGLGIEARLQALLETATPEQAEALEAGFRRLVGGTNPGVALTEEGMGTSYQAFCIAQRGMQPWPFGAVIEEETAEEEEAAGEEPATAGGQQQHKEQPAAPAESGQQPPVRQQS